MGKHTNSSPPWECRIQCRTRYKSVTIALNDDSKKEANETFYLDLFGYSGNSLFTKKRGLGTILNDD